MPTKPGRAADRKRVNKSQRHELRYLIEQIEQAQSNAMAARTAAVDAARNCEHTTTVLARLVERLRYRQRSRANREARRK